MVKKRLPTKRTFFHGRIALHHGDTLALYDRWPEPVVIVSDGPYGLGDDRDGVPLGGRTLAEWYEPHAAAWARRATPETTLWFWNTEVGWAAVHPVLARHGWRYRQTVLWDKGVTHAAKNANTRTLRKLPTVTEACAHYVREPEWRRKPGGGSSVQAWLRAEWDRTGLPLRDANRACGVGNMVSRRYLTADHRWYCPPAGVVARLADYAERHGNPAGRPYFSLDGKRPVTSAGWDRVTREAGGAWERRRAKFACEHGLTNVWRADPVRGAARVRAGGGSGAVVNQKPLELMERSVRLASDPGDVVWDPFGGTFTVAVAAHRLGRRCVAAEVRRAVYDAGVARVSESAGGRATPMRR